jgi:putative transposase
MHCRAVDGAMGFWKALDEVFPGTRHQRCWVHKIANILNKLPKSMQPAVKTDLREIWQADNRVAAETAMTIFAEKYGAKYEKAVTCLTKDRDALLAFYDFPANHWDHLRTGNRLFGFQGEVGVMVGSEAQLGRPA